MSLYKTITIVIATLFCSAVIADAPQLINYQGKLYQADGSTPLTTGDYDIQVEIFDDPTAGTKTWGPLTLASTPVVKGFFNVLLGNDDSTATINTAFATANAYLQITVDKEGDGFGDNTPILPRQQVLSTPYALQATHATYATHGVPVGAVIPFNLAVCPETWSTYTPAFGRFIRGIDSSGSSIDPDGVRALGNLQDDTFQAHTHTIPSVQTYPSGAGSGPHTPWVQSGSSKATAGATGKTSSETRPKNVALLYCEKD